ncbi:MAG: gliding motility-associated C-terminal domain-containing protein [Sphingobacteriales bacterium]|jgi:gliding motility-associated-like protein|nr:gliding motility-associated C-terminal domain-containing protein [Sphingobacteriales bacterium]
MHPIQRNMQLKFIRFSFLTLALTLVVAGSSIAQVSAGKKYRVIAYKNGQPQITSVSNEVIVIPAMSIYVPNAFTPNGDGMNDTWGVVGEAIEEFSIQVFNRWGQLVYESSNPNVHWDGTHMGNQVPMGTYVYKVTAMTNKGGRQSKEGQVNVVL